MTQTGELLRILPNTLEAQVEERGSAIRALIRDAVLDNPEPIQNVTAIFRKWMRERAIVRVIGAGRALLAASLPANRLSHGGAAVSLMGDKAPLPNSRLGGGIIAASATGETRPVIEDMERAEKINVHRAFSGQEPLVVVGISTSHPKAEKFRSLCTPGYYIGLQKEPEYVTGVTLRGLADLEEFAISELLDTLVVRAGTEIGCNFKTGHEDFGPTGPHHQHKSQH